MAAKVADRDTLESGNQRFHDAYGSSLAQQPRGPVIVLLNNELIVRRGELRRAFVLESDEFTAAKLAAHLTVATFLLADDPERLRANLEHVEKVLATCARAGAIEREIVRLLEVCRSTARRWLSGVEAPQTERERAEFAQQAREPLLRLTDLATDAELRSLHAATKSALELLSEPERDQLEVVVAGNHQARARSLGMQYFARRFGEHEGEEARVAYGENIETEEEALELVATRRLDRELALAFFGDERRMQRDLLADAATRGLDRMHIEADRPSSAAKRA
jgi:hypothetical protein